MKKYKYFIGVALTIFVIAPSITFASWWNPFSWSIFHMTAIQKIETPIATTTPININQTTSTPQIIPATSSTPTPKIIVPEEKKVIKTISPISIQAPTESTSCPTGMVCTPITPNTTTPPIKTSSKYIDPATGDYFQTPEAYGNYVARVLTQKEINPATGKVFTLSDFGLEKNIPQKTPIQICQERFGVHSTVSNKKDNDGNRLCECEDGYVTNSSKTSCQKQQGYDGSDPYGVFNDGVTYSPEQRRQIECAYYGGASCYNSAPVQIYNTYQYTPPPAPVQTNVVNCSNYQTEKANLDQQSANSGTLFSGARVNAENALKAKYPGCY